MSEQKNPIIVGLLSVVPGLINTITSVIRDKKKKDDPADLTKSVNIIDTVEKISTGVALSSKRILNVCGTGTMISIAVHDYFANGLSWQCVALFIVSGVFSAVMAWITKQSEQ